MVITAVTLFLGGCLLMLNTWAVVRYWFKWRQAPRGVLKLLPLHIWLVAASYDLLVILVIARGLSGANLHDAWAFVRIPALLMGLAGMFALIHFQKKTYLPRRKR